MDRIDKSHLPVGPNITIFQPMTLEIFSFGDNGYFGASIRSIMINKHSMGCIDIHLHEKRGRHL